MSPPGLITQCTQMMLLSVTRGTLEAGGTEPTTRPGRTSKQLVRTLTSYKLH